MAHLVEGAGLVAGAVGAAADLALDAALAPLGDLVVHQVAGALVGRVVKYLRPGARECAQPWQGKMRTGTSQVLELPSAVRKDCTWSSRCSDYEERTVLKSHVPRH